LVNWYAAAYQGFWYTSWCSRYRYQGLFGKALNFLKTPGGAYAGITAASALAAAGLDPENPNEMPRDTGSIKIIFKTRILNIKSISSTRRCRIIC
jgi:hypothetical protein